MTKRWTADEDYFLFAHFEAVGDMVGTHDLNKPAGAATRRVKRLKEIGAWDVLKQMNKAKQQFLVMTGRMSPEWEI